MAVRRFMHIGRPASLTLGAVLFALLAILLLAGAAQAAKPGAPKAKAPAGAIATATPTFTWNKAARATTYEVRVYDAGTLKVVLKKAGLTKLSWKSSKTLPRNVDLMWAVRGVNADGMGAPSNVSGFKIKLAVGNAYQGGKVAYIFKSGDPGYVAGQTHGLIAAKTDQKPTGVQWYNGSFAATGATGTALGTGFSNTNMIIWVQGAPSSGYAAGVARAYQGGGYTDWYLPSKDELNQLFLHQAKIGGFGPHYYWSSSEFDASTAWAKAFDLSSPAYAYSKNGASYVRAVRVF